MTDEPKPAKPPRIIGYDTRSDGIDYRVCPKCANRRMFSGSESEEIYVIAQGDQGFCEICGKALG